MRGIWATATYFCISQADGVELLKEDYSLTEHRQLVQEDSFQCIVFADGGPSLKVPLTNEHGTYWTHGTREGAISINTQFCCITLSIHINSSIITLWQWQWQGFPAHLGRRAKRSSTTFSPSRFPAKPMVAFWLHPRGLLEQLGSLCLRTHNARQAILNAMCSWCVLHNIWNSLKPYAPHQFSKMKSLAPLVGPFLTMRHIAASKVSFQVEEPLLPLGTVMALNWAQRRYFVNLTGILTGVVWCCSGILWQAFPVISCIKGSQGNQGVCFTRPHLLCFHDIIQ